MFAARNMLFAGAGGAFDADAADYFSRIVTAGSTISTANKTAVNAFIVGCKADGIWSAIKASCILAGADTLAGALVPLVGAAPTNFNFVADDYSRTTGLVGDGSTKNLSTNRNNNADPQDSNHMALWITTTGGTGRFAMSVGGGAVGANTLGTGGGTRSRSDTLSTTIPLPTGLFGITRNGAASFTARAGGTNYTHALTSQVPFNGNVSVFRDGDSVSFSSEGRYAFYSMGESLDITQLDARLATLMGALT